MTTSSLAGIEAPRNHTSEAVAAKLARRSLLPVLTAGLLACHGPQPVQHDASHGLLPEFRRAPPAPESREGLASCRDGERRRGGDGCNYCTCRMGRWSSTLIDCHARLRLDGTALCYPLGVRDVDPAPGLQVRCTAHVPRARGSSDAERQIPIPECPRNANAWAWPKAFPDICLELRTDDRVSASCIAHRGDLAALEIVARIRPGATLDATEIAVTCRHPTQCPNW